MYVTLAATTSIAPTSLNSAIFAQPLWLQIWIIWMVLINVPAALIFIRRTEAKWVLLAMAGNAIFMNWLFAQYGYQRILGLSHVVFWTPLVIYLWLRREKWDMTRLSGKWLAILFATNLLSLIIDYADVARYLLGERV